MNDTYRHPGFVANPQGDRNLGAGIESAIHTVRDIDSPRLKRQAPDNITNLNGQIGELGERRQERLEDGGGRLRPLRRVNHRFILEVGAGEHGRTGHHHERKGGIWRQSRRFGRSLLHCAWRVCRKARLKLKLKHV